MADFIYLLENRLSLPQRTALHKLRDIARAKGLTLFLVGGAVRDLTSGSPVRDLDVVVQGNALKLKKDIEKSGAVITGELEAAHALFSTFPGGVRVEIGSALAVTYPKPGKPVARLASIQDDLRRRDFTANAMALSLNDGSYGLLMDPLNGVADIENRELRLVSNYGFIEDPVRMVRAARFMARLGWQMDEKTQARYDTGKQEGYISTLSAFHRGYETEEIFHEEDPLRVLRRLEAEGWMSHLAPVLTSAKVNTAELDRLRETQMQLQMQGIYPDAATANFPYLTAKLAPKDVTALKKSFPNQHFVAEIESLEERAKVLATQLSSKATSAPSQFWKLMYTTPPELVLWVAHTTRSAPLQARFKSFYTEWPLTRQKLPHTLMQEMRITPELPVYNELLEKVFFELLDSKLSTPEEMKAYLEPFSPPAPPPPVHLRRPRPAKKEARVAKSRKKTVASSPDELDSIALQPVDQSAVTALPAAAPASAPRKPAKSAPPQKIAAKTEAAPKPKQPAAPAKAPAKAPPAKTAKPASSKAPKPAVKSPAKNAVRPSPVTKKPAVKAPAKPSAKSAKTVPAKKSIPGKAAKSAPKTISKKPVSKAATKKAPTKKPAAKAVIKHPAKKAATKTKPSSKSKPAPTKKKR